MKGKKENHSTDGESISSRGIIDAIYDRFIRKMTLVIDQKRTPLIDGKGFHRKK